MYEKYWIRVNTYIHVSSSNKRYNRCAVLLRQQQSSIMKTILQLEEVAMFLLGCWGIYQLHLGLAWWLYLMVFFAPDIGMLGYLINTRVGAITYNLFHHKAIAILFVLIGYYQEHVYTSFIGLILFSHASFDRVFGYGLKYSDNFKHTSLGEL